MLRLPKFDVRRPRTVSQAVRLLHRYGHGAMVVAGGTDLLPNMKHELFTPELVVSLGQIPELVRIEVDAETDELVIGAMTTLATVSQNPLVLERAPALAQAASLVAGPQLRVMGTLGGNVMLDTRCQWYNQTYFWREALGFCLKKDGTACHVVESGRKCVAAASNDSAPALMTLGATLVLEGPDGRRTLAVDDFWKADGIFNKELAPAEILTEVRLPRIGERHFGAYGKLRDRGSIDFPLLGCAVRLDLDTDDAVEAVDIVLVALAARPVRLKKAPDLLVGLHPGTPEFDEALEAVARQARKQCHPLANIPGDPDYRREMVPVYVRRTVRAALEDQGPVHAV